MGTSRSSPEIGVRLRTPCAAWWNDVDGYLDLAREGFRLHPGHEVRSLTPISGSESDPDLIPGRRP